MAMDRKYFKPRSLTWWSGFVPLIAGVFIAAEPVHQLADYVTAVSSMFGDAHAATLINAGLALIGLRGANG